MLESRGWAKAALLLNLAGTVLLYLSFQATSSNLKIVTTEDASQTALCVNGRGLLVADVGGGFSIGMDRCPEWHNARPAAVVNIERPFLVTLGFLMTAVGFFIQYMAVPDAKTIDQLREQLRVERKLTKAREKNNPSSQG